MIKLGMIGVPQLIVVFISLGIPVGLFFIGYHFGKKSGYNKRAKEEALKK
jgi:hypothetical protein